MAVAAWTGACVDWRAELEALKEHLAPALGRSETRRAAGAFIDGVLSSAERKTGWMLAEQAGSVVSSVLFGALCGAGVLPFGRAAFEATITEAGIGVAGSLRGFALGFDGAAAGPVSSLVSASVSVSLSAAATFDWRSCQ